MANQAFNFTHPCVWTLRCFTDYLHNKVPFGLEEEIREHVLASYSEGVKCFFPSAGIWHMQVLKE